MPTQSSDRTIDAIRSASRHIVRQLGFMGGNFAGTGLHPSSVHALIEIEQGGMTARALGTLLHLEKSTISRMLARLAMAGYVAETPTDDGRIKLLALTAAGQRMTAQIHSFGRAQVSAALDRLDAGKSEKILTGLELYASALSDAPHPDDIAIVSGYRTGLIAAITGMHARYYAQSAGFGQKFESVVASGLAQFCDRLDNRANGIWLAMQGRQIVGSVAIDGEDLGGGDAHLRWFIVDDGMQGRGVGRKLLSAALDFADARAAPATHLWTYDGLSVARHLYEAHGFTLAEQRLGTQWGAPVQEQRFIRYRR